MKAHLISALRGARDILPQRHGYKVKNIRYNNHAKVFLGMVEDPKSLLQDKFVTCSWNKLGNCTNAYRQDCNLKLK
jgi:hypothetical protein